MGDVVGPGSFPLPRCTVDRLAVSSAYGASSSQSVACVHSTTHWRGSTPSCTVVVLEPRRGRSPSHFLAIPGPSRIRALRRTSVGVCAQLVQTAVQSRRLVWREAEGTEHYPGAFKAEVTRCCAASMGHSHTSLAMHSIGRFIRAGWWVPRSVKAAAHKYLELFMNVSAALPSLGTYPDILVSLITALDLLSRA